MKPIIKQYILLLCLSLSVFTLKAQTVVDSFEYPSDDDLIAAWTPSGNATINVTNAVASQSTGIRAMQVNFNFPSVAYTTETVKGPTLETVLSITTNQFLSFRIKGDPAFTTADFRNLYLYAYDADGYFGRWGGPVPNVAAWQVVNYKASNVEKPYDSDQLPDLTRIVRFAFFQYGSQAAIPAYSAAIFIDDLTVRDTELNDTPPIVERIVENFEYDSLDSLAAVWTPSQNTALAMSADVSPNSPGTNAMKVSFNFPSVEYTTETIRAIELPAPIAIAPGQYLSFRLKGDPAFAAADFRNLYLYAYDSDGNFGRWGSPVPNTDVWQPVNYLASSIELPYDSTKLPNFNSIVKFAFFQYGSAGAIPAYSAVISLDDLAVRNTALVDIPPTTNSMVEPFEYATGDDLLAAWTPSANALISVTDEVSPRSSGTAAMKVDFNFISSPFATEIIRGPLLTTPVSIGNSQYVSFRVKGDAAFASSDFHNLYLYVYDTEGHFARWGASVPTNDTWVVWSFSASSIQLPFDSTVFPNLKQIVRFAFFQYGSQAAIPDYTASISLDEIRVLNAPLTEFPLPASPRTLIDDFESYPSDTELLSFYSYLTQPSATVATASLETLAPQGTNALKLAIDFSSGTYPWGSIRSPKVAPFSFPTNAVVSMRFKGDPALAGVADGGTTFWLTFYDAQGEAISYIAPASVVTSSEWVTLTATLADFGDSSTVDIGNLVQWRILVQGWQGSSATPALSGTFYVDDIQMIIPVDVPKLSIRSGAGTVTITWPSSVTGFTLEANDALATSGWNAVGGVVGNQVTLTPGIGNKFFRLKK